ncbi:peptide deformylase, mitochondrial-like isoform X2 [Salvelinus fontinalis]|uniref:peptide deformylase, mitochondrial-like isoform X2 n=1 Tax=Salvelinus fontinalis TaxID=8038 RepID=UPI00248681D9|nr:peptide deformylase, mitochondrial-like isoform X2 [Salvelinus fontinalis]
MCVSKAPWPHFTVSIGWVVPVSSVAPSRSLQASRWVTQCYESRLQWWTLGPEVQEVIRTMLRVLDGRTVKFQEACESISGFSATVPHYLSVEVPGLNEKAEPVTWQVSGWPARILQHEMDHLDVVWYIDRMDSKTFNVKWAAQNE